MQMNQGIPMQGYQMPQNGYPMIPGMPGMPGIPGMPMKHNMQMNPFM